MRTLKRRQILVWGVAASAFILTVAYLAWRNDGHSSGAYSAAPAATSATSDNRLGPAVADNPFGPPVGVMTPPPVAAPTPPTTTADHEQVPVEVPNERDSTAAADDDRRNLDGSSDREVAHSARFH